MFESLDMDSKSQESINNKYCKQGVVVRNTIITDATMLEQFQNSIEKSDKWENRFKNWTCLSLG